MYRMAQNDKMMIIDKKRELVDQMSRRVKCHGQKRADKGRTHVHPATQTDRNGHALVQIRQSHTVDFAHRP